MLLREASPEDTRLQVRLAYNQVFGELTPEQQAAFPFEQVFEHIHQVVRQQRTLTLVSDLPEDYFETALSTGCAVAVSLAVIDGLMLVFQIIGIPLAARSPAAREVASLLGEETLTRFRFLLRQWQYANKKIRRESSIRYSRAWSGPPE